MLRIIHRLQPLFLVLAVLFIVLLLRSQWAELSQHTWRLNPLWLAVSALFMLAAWALEIQIWRQLLAVVGARLPYWPAVRIWFLSAILRYVPGNIWQPLSMTLQCQRRGIAPEATLTSVAFYQILILLAASPIAAVYFGLTGNWGLLTGLLQAWTPLLVAVGLAPVVMFVVRPSWLIEVVNWVLAKFNRPALVAGLTRGSAALVLVLAIADWLLWGASFAALTFALQDFTLAEMVRLAPDLVAAYAIAYTIGFVSLITPSGIGVREGALYVLLAPLLGGGVVTIAAIAMRVWITVGELLAAGACLIFLREKNLTPAQPALVDSPRGAVQ
jgi:glycosyltransferase 2 family protein